MKCDWRREQSGYLYRKGFDSKLADPVGGRVTGRGQFRVQKQVVEG